MATGSKPKGKKKPEAAKENVGGIGLLDLLRVLAGLFVVSGGLSYMITGNSLTWGYRPWFASWDQIKNAWKGPLLLTEEELLKYDGSDPSLPIYLALNGTIYDVTAGRPTYQPGGSYHFFAGRDAARAFLTGCFQEDLTPDLRGVEEMFIPIDPSEAEEDDDDSGPKPKPYQPPAKATPANPADQGGSEKKAPLTEAELEARREKELKHALKEVHDGIAHWAKTFRGETGRPYFEVGKVKRERGWLEKLPKRKLCKHARKSRPKRTDD